MSVRITDADRVAIYDSVSGWAFGPTFTSEEEANAYLNSLPMDARQMTPQELDEALDKFYLARQADEDTE